VETASLARTSSPRLKEQLGLELQPGNSMMPLLIVDSAHAPLEN
jgi:uncharacterized protein (TIGR03435 family)